MKGLVTSGLMTAEALPLAGRLQEVLGSLICRDISADRLLSDVPPGDHELLVMPLRVDGMAATWLAQLRRQRVTAPALLVLPDRDWPQIPDLAGLGAVDFLVGEASRFELARILGLLRRAHARELELLDLRGEVGVLRGETDRRRQEVGQLTFSLATREIDDELVGDRIEERAARALSKHIQRSERFGTPLSCFMLSIDGLDKIKQVCGASFAAFVLVQVAYRLKRSLRPTDHLWRYHGDNFVLLSSGTDDDAVYGQARRLIKAVAADPLEDSGHAVRPSISIGAARFRREMTSSGELIDAAKLALGTAQSQGKGKFMLI